MTNVLLKETAQYVRQAKPPVKNISKPPSTAARSFAHKKVSERNSVLALYLAANGCSRNIAVCFILYPFVFC